MCIRECVCVCVCVYIYKYVCKCVCVFVCNVVLGCGYEVKISERSQKKENNTVLQKQLKRLNGRIKIRKIVLSIVTTIKQTKSEYNFKNGIG